MRLKKVVLDTNVWLSGLFWEGEASKIIELAEKGKIKVLISEEIINEIVKVIQRESKFKKFIGELDEKIKDVIRTVLSISNLISIRNKINVVKEDPSDNTILETALDGKADYLITYDKHLLNIKEFGKIKIIQPNEFLNG